MGGIAKMLGGKLHAFEIAFFRCLFGLAAILPFLWDPNGASLKTSRPWLYLLRCLIGITAILGSFYSLANLPLAASVAVNFTKPLFMLVLAALGGWYMVQQFQKSATLQDCFASGRTNCAPINAR